MTRAFTGSLGTVAAINGHFLMSSSCGALAWLIWPRTPEWWGLGVLSVSLGAMALTALIKALQGIVRLERRDRAVAAFEALGTPPKSAQTASHDALVKAGMVDDHA